MVYKFKNKWNKLTDIFILQLSWCGGWFVEFTARTSFSIGSICIGRRFWQRATWTFNGHGYFTISAVWPWSIAVFIVFGFTWCHRIWIWWCRCCYWFICRCITCVYTALCSVVVYRRLIGPGIWTSWATRCAIR